MTNRGNLGDNTKIPYITQRNRNEENKMLRCRYRRIITIFGRPKDKVYLPSLLT